MTTLPLNSEHLKDTIFLERRFISSGQDPPCRTSQTWKALVLLDKNLLKGQNTFMERFLLLLGKIILWGPRFH